jgi:hypothetical protein
MCAEQSKVKKFAAWLANREATGANGLSAMMLNVREGDQPLLCCACCSPEDQLAF